MSTNDTAPDHGRTEVPPADDPTEALEATTPTENLAASVTPTQPLETESPEEPMGVPDWRSAQSTEEAIAAAAPPADSTDAAGSSQAPAGPGSEESAGLWSSAQPVWTATSTLPPPTGELPEAPFRSVRVGQLVWAGIVMAIGVFLIGLALVNDIDVPFLLIGLIALLGVGLIVAAVATSRRKR